MYPKILPNAIFIADAHESDRRDDFYHFLLAIHSKQIKTPQLFLMGDMFDLLVGKVTYGVKKYKKYLELLEKISQDIEVYYFEGNHDFSLSNLFLHVKIIPIQKQPMLFELEATKSLCALSHGDKYGDFIHNFYTFLIRSKGLLKILNFLDERIGFGISKKIEKDLLQKDICRKIEGFKSKIATKLKLYSSQNLSYILEGHYHQNKEYKFGNLNYINFSSFACNQSYFIVEFFNGVKFTQKKLRGFDV